MRKGLFLGAGTALAFVAGFSVLATAPPTRAPEQAPAIQTFEKAQDDVAALRIQTPTLPERERRNAEKLIREASSRIEGAQELIPAVNPRLAKYLQNETRVAKSRIEEARKLVEQGGNH